jgi:hypothetical protein
MADTDAHARLREAMALAACRYFREKVRGEPAGMACECMVDGDGACVQWLGLADTQIALIAADEDATELVAGAREDSVDDLPAGFTLNWMLKGKGAEHDGDCTKKSYSCLRCLYDEHTKHMRAALSALAPKDTGNG